MASNSRDIVARQAKSHAVHPTPQPNDTGYHRLGCRRVRSSFGNTVLSGAIFRIGKSGRLLWASDAARIVLTLLKALDANRQYPSLSRDWIQQLWNSIQTEDNKTQTCVLDDLSLPCRACIHWNPHYPNGLTVSLWRIDSNIDPFNCEIDPLWETILNKLDANKPPS